MSRASRSAVEEAQVGGPGPTGGRIPHDYSAGHLHRCPEIDGDLDRVTDAQLERAFQSHATVGQVRHRHVMGWAPAGRTRPADLCL